MQHSYRKGRTYNRIWNGSATPNGGGGQQYQQSDLLTLGEQHIYGSSRLGVRRAVLPIAKREVMVAAESFPPGTPYVIFSYSPNITTTTINPFVSTYETGRKQYELSNHLGNVLTVITDHVWANRDNNNEITHFTPDIVAANDYYPFGMIMPGRSFNSGSYRYGGAGGQEMDNEISGVGNSYTAEYWQYDSRLMRRWNVDPITYPWQSSYAAFNNNPIIFVDPLGLYGSKRDARRARRQVRKDGMETGDLYKTGDDWAFGASDSDGYYTYVGTGTNTGNENKGSYIAKKYNLFDNWMKFGFPDWTYSDLKGNSDGGLIGVRQSSDRGGIMLITDAGGASGPASSSSHRDIQQVDANKIAGFMLTQKMGKIPGLKGTHANPGAYKTGQGPAKGLKNLNGEGQVGEGTVLRVSNDEEIKGQVEKSHQNNHQMLEVIDRTDTLVEWKPSGMFNLYLDIDTDTIIVPNGHTPEIFHNGRSKKYTKL